jgi:hypothetical protein
VGSRDRSVQARNRLAPLEEAPSTEVAVAFPTQDDRARALRTTRSLATLKGRHRNHGLAWGATGASLTADRGVRSGSFLSGRLATVTVQIRADLTERAIHASTESPMLALDLLTLEASRVVVVDRRGLRFRRVELKASGDAPLLSDRRHAGTLFARQRPQVAPERSISPKGVRV